MSKTVLQHPSSWRDPSGFVFESNGILYRQINNAFKEHFDHFITSGCYDHLVKTGLLVSHTGIPENLTGSADFYKTIKPQRIEFISYPYEWCFDMLKDAALLTLQLVKEALQFGMILKDASPYNIQWNEGRPVFIDTLSFEKYEEVPWIGYRQFCENFLGPLLIMHYSKQQLPGLLLAWPDGIPLSVVRSFLPRRSRLSLHTYLHIHLHAKIAGKKTLSAANTSSLSKPKLLNLVNSLELLVRKLRTPPKVSTWSDYYDDASGRNDYLEQKKKLISAWLDSLPGIKKAADLGANEGEFSMLISAKNIYTIAADFDPYCINTLYNKIKSGGQRNIQPIVIDLSNPTPSTGVNNKERDSFFNRVNVDVVSALALIHHLAIGKNIPFERIAETLSRLGSYLIIEFVPRDDEKLQSMLRQKKDIYTGYTEANFVSALEKYFKTIERQVIPGSVRILYLMKRNDG